MEKRKVDIRIQEGGAAVNPLIFGHFIEFIENCIRGGVYDPGHPASDEHGIRQDVLELAKGLQPTILRWPGGTFANIYHWMDAVGPIEERKKRKNLIWGGVEDNVFGTAEFVKYCRDLGAEPMLCVNMATGTAEEAANWVEYCNGEPGTYYADLRVAHGYPEPFGVKYWCIGNESYAEPDIGAQHVPERYISDGWEFTKHMKLMDPTIKLIFVGDGGDTAWNRKILDEFAPVCDYLSIHHYSGGKETYAPFITLEKFRKTLAEAAALVKEYSEMDRPFNKWYRFPARAESIKLCIDEWNIWSSNDASEGDRYGLKLTYSWRDALWTACMMNTFIRSAESVGITNLAQMVNVIAPIVANAEGSFAQPTYHVLRIYREMVSGAQADCLVDNVPLIDAGNGCSISAIDCAAAVRADGTIILCAANISETEAYELRLAPGLRAEGALCLGADSFGATNAIGRESVRCVQKGADEALVLEPGTISMITIKK